MRGGARLLARADTAVGDGIERLIAGHHRRRLGRLGWATRALDAPPGGWAAGDPPPRKGTKFELLVDGAEALPRLEADLAGAESHVHLAGWYFSPDFRLREDGPALRELLGDLAARGVAVRLLAWAGAPLRLFRPSRGEAREMRNALERGTHVRSALDDRERPMHCHHEKIAVVDDRVAFVGGIDLTSLNGDRLDTSEHPPRGTIGWHDCAARLEGPAVADVGAHFLLRWHEVTGELLAGAAAPPAVGDAEVQVVRTVPERIYRALPHGDFRILETYVRALRSAERLVYLENQFLWSPELTGVLAAKLRQPPRDDFRLVLLLPSNPNNGADDTRGQLAVLTEADGGAGRLLACTLFQPGAPSRPVYVHAKVAVVDDRFLTVGSANLNEHSLFNDTEMNVVTWDPGLARAARLRLWSEHLQRPTDDLRGAAGEIVDGLWRPLAEEQLRLRAKGISTGHRLARLPPVSRRSRRLLGPLNGLVVDG